MKDADEATVAGCEFLGTISGQSMIGGLATSLGAQKAMKSARVQAENLGATHIVFVSVKGGDFYSNSQSTARAYRCR